MEAGACMATMKESINYDVFVATVALDAGVECVCTKDEVCDCRGDTCECICCLDDWPAFGDVLLERLTPCAVRTCRYRACAEPWTEAAECINDWEWDGVDRGCFVWHMLGTREARLVSMALCCLVKYGVRISGVFGKVERVRRVRIHVENILDDARAADPSNWRVEVLRAPEDRYLPYLVVAAETHAHAYVAICEQIVREHGLRTILDVLERRFMEDDSDPRDDLDEAKRMQRWVVRERARGMLVQDVLPRLLGAERVFGRGVTRENIATRLFRTRQVEYEARLLSLSAHAASEEPRWDVCAHGHAGRHSHLTVKMDCMFGTLLMGLERLGILSPHDEIWVDTLGQYSYKWRRSHNVTYGTRPRCRKRRLHEDKPVQ